MGRGGGRVRRVRRRVPSLLWRAVVAPLLRVAAVGVPSRSPLLLRRRLLERPGVGVPPVAAPVPRAIPRLAPSHGDSLPLPLSDQAIQREERRVFLRNQKDGSGVAAASCRNGGGCGDEDDRVGMKQARAALEICGGSRMLPVGFLRLLGWRRVSCWSLPLLRRG